MKISIFFINHSDIACLYTIRYNTFTKHSIERPHNHFIIHTIPFSFYYSFNLPIPHKSKTKERNLFAYEKNFISLIKQLSQPLPPEFKTVSGKLPYTLLNDLMFRIVFESNPDGLKKLLCSLLHMNESEIDSVEINNPILLGEKITDKYYILDLNLLLNPNKKIHLELQVLQQDFWTNRSLCYLCKNFSKLNSGEDYEQLKPLIQIDILDFELYHNSKEFYSTYHLANDKTHRIYSDNLALHVLQLNQEEYATEEDKTYGIDYWAKLFKSTTWEELKMLMEEHRNLESTVEVIYRVNTDDYARAEIEAREDYLRQQKTIQNQMERLNTKVAEQEQEIERLRLLLKQKGIEY